jgi:predicted PolB exonuclease-like 3'-5' exonuclease
MSFNPKIPVVAFDLETIPDAAGLRAYCKLPDDETQTDKETVEKAYAILQEERHSTFAPHVCQKILVCSCVQRDKDGFRVVSLGNPQGDNEGQVVYDFFDLIERRRPQLVSWNGAGFDLPVLNARAMIHGVQAPLFWSEGDASDKDFKFNNYQNRYHSRHLDLMDRLAMYQNGAKSRLDVMAKLCGFPGKIGGVDGSQVYDTWLAGGFDGVRFYCETDVVNTYLLYVRFLFISGQLSLSDYELETQFVFDTIVSWVEREPRWDDFLVAWEANSKG